MGQDPSRLTYAAIAVVWGSFLDALNENLSLILLTSYFLLYIEQQCAASISAGCIILHKGYIFSADMDITHSHATTSSQNSNYPEIISKSLSISLLWS